MRALLIVFYALLVFGLGACASRATQTEKWLSEGHPGIKTETIIPGVAFVDQSAGYCGPATLAMAMNHWGMALDVNQLAPEVYHPKMKGSLQLDMVSASRRHKMMAVLIEGLPALFQELNQGHPVIVFENLSVSWLPRWHYALVFGYDQDHQQVVMHSGHESTKHWDMTRFERSWMLGNYWGLVVLPPGQVAPSAGEIANLTAAAGLEQLGFLKEAQLSYESILNEWPQSLGALIGLGNLSFQNHNFKDSAGYLQRATFFHPQSAIAWHNLAIAQGTGGDLPSARKSAAQAIGLVSVDQRPAYLLDLKKWTQEPSP